MPDFEVAWIMDETAGSPVEAAMRVEAIVRHGSSPWYGSVMIVTDLASGRRTRVDTQQLGPPVTEELDPGGPAAPQPPGRQPTGTGPQPAAAGARRNEHINDIGDASSAESGPSAGSAASHGRKVTVEASGGTRHSFTIAGDDTLTILVDDQPVLSVDELGPGYWHGDRWRRIQPRPPVPGPELGELHARRQAVRRQAAFPRARSHRHGEPRARSG